MPSAIGVEQRLTVAHRPDASKRGPMAFCRPKMAQKSTSSLPMSVRLRARALDACFEAL